MLQGSSRLWAALVAAMVAPAATAQVIIVDPAPLLAGTTITIGVKDPGSAGRTVLLEITGLTFPLPETVEVKVDLDANGEGKVEWDVPYWLAVNFNLKGAEEVTREIMR